MKNNNPERSCLGYYIYKCVDLLATAARDVLDALLVATTGEFGLEELVEALAAHFLGDEAAWEDDDVGIVVLADEVSDLWLPNETGTDALVLVEGHRDAFA